MEDGWIYDSSQAGDLPAIPVSWAGRINGYSIWGIPDPTSGVPSRLQLEAAHLHCNLFTTLRMYVQFHDIEYAR